MPVPAGGIPAGGVPAGPCEVDTYFIPDYAVGSTFCSDGTVYLLCDGTESTPGSFTHFTCTQPRGDWVEADTSSSADYGASAYTASDSAVGSAYGSTVDTSMDSSTDEGAGAPDAGSGGETTATSNAGGSTGGASTHGSTGG